MAKRKIVYLQPQQPKPLSEIEQRSLVAKQQASAVLAQFTCRDVPVGFLESIYKKHLSTDMSEPSRYFGGASSVSYGHAQGYLESGFRLNLLKSNEAKQLAQPSVDTQPQQQPAFSELGTDRFNKMIEGLGGREKTTPEQRAAIWQVAHSL